MGKIDAIIFDMDGTLLRLDISNEDMELVRWKLKQYFRRFGIDKDFRPLLSTIHETIEELSKRGLSKTEVDVIARGAFQIVDKNEVAGAARAWARDGVKNTLASLKEYRLGIVTSNGRNCAIIALQASGICSKLFSVIVTREDTKKHKPNPEPLLLAIQKMDIDGKHANIVFVGDHVHDMICGKKIESRMRSGCVTTVAITGGLCKRQDLIQCQKADFVIESFGELMDKIRIIESE